MVVVGACIAVVGPCLFVVFKEWGRPDSCCTQFCYVVKAINDTLYITAKTAVYTLFVACFSHALYGIVALIAVHKTVRHNQVDHITRVESLALAATFAAGVNGVIYTSSAFAFLQRDAIGAWLVYCQIYKQIVLTLSIVLTFYL